jgi:hypothetical protein
LTAAVSYLSRLNTTSMRLPIVLSAITCAAALAAGCYKGPEYVPPVYSCDCGSLTYQGREVPLKLAEAVVWDSLEFRSRRYHLVADLRTEDEIKAHLPAHDFVVMLEFDTINRPAFYIPADGIVHQLQQINHGDELTPVRDFVCTNGVISPQPALTGGTERVSFQMLMKEVVDGTPVGFETPLTGSFKVDI